MATFSYFLHPPRDNFAETMTELEQQTWDSTSPGSRSCSRRSS